MTKLSKLFINFMYTPLLMTFIMLFSALPTSVAAGNYISLGFVDTNYNVQAPDSAFFDDNAMGYEVTIGFPFPVGWLYTELSLADNGTSTNNVGPLNYELGSQSIAVLLHGAVPVATIGGHTIKAHARLGYSATQFIGTETAMNIATTATDIGLTYGLGVSLWITPHWGVELDYMQRQHEIALLPFTLTPYHMQQGILKAVYVF